MANGEWHVQYCNTGTRVPVHYYCNSYNSVHVHVYTRVLEYRTGSGIVAAIVNIAIPVPSRGIAILNIEYYQYTPDIAMNGSS